MIPRQTVALIVIVAVFGIAWLEALLAETALITPINSLFVKIMLGLGAATGLALGILTALDKTKILSLGRRILVVLFLPILTAVGFYGIAWRVVDWQEFGLSNAPFEQATYRLTGASNGRKGRRDTVEIDPFDIGDTDIPVPKAQYEAVWSDYKDYCITVDQRKSPSGAIEIRTDGEYTLAEPEVAAISRCDDGRPATGSTNPWK